MDELYLPDDEPATLTNTSDLITNKRNPHLPPEGIYALLP